MRRRCRGTVLTSSRAISTTRRRCAERWPACGRLRRAEHVGGGCRAEEVQGKRVATLAREADVEHYVYSSVGSAHKRTGIPHFDNKWRVEETVRHATGQASAAANCLSCAGRVALRDSLRETLANLSRTGHLRRFSDQPVADIVQCGEPAPKPIKSTTCAVGWLACW